MGWLYAVGIDDETFVPEERGRRRLSLKSALR